MPEELHGWYCTDCCPACNPKVAAQHAVIAEAAPIQQAA
jgi:hypothetical protein